VANCGWYAVWRSDPNLTIALQFALRHEPGVEVVASVTAASGLMALAESSTVDLFVIDAAQASPADGTATSRHSCLA
jgi:DNA-binding NarL/FixJ family response regulator